MRNQGCRLCRGGVHILHPNIVLNIELSDGTPYGSRRSLRFLDVRAALVLGAFCPPAFGAPIGLWICSFLDPALIPSSSLEDPCAGARARARQSWRAQSVSGGFVKLCVVQSAEHKAVDDIQV